MQYSSIILAVLAATGAIAAPAPAAASKDVRVLLQNDSAGIPFTLAAGTTVTVKSPEVFETLTIKVTGATSKDIRCQILDKKQKVLTVTRDANKNRDSFAMGNGNPWTIDNPSAIGSIKCPAAPKASA